MRHRPFGSILLQAILLPLVAGCLFSTRSGGGGGGPLPPPYHLPTEPPIVLVNLKATTDARVVGNFDRSLASDYRFRFDPFEASGDTAWTKDRFVAALTALFDGKGPTTLTWTPRDSGSVGQDRLYRNLGYRLVMQRSPSDTSRVTIAGRCNLYMREEGGLWFAYRWEDLRDSPSLPTWGWALLHPGLPR